MFGPKICVTSLRAPLSSELCNCSGNTPQSKTLDFSDHLTSVILPQVAVISWGTKQTCDSRTAVRDNRPLDARDFHISVFSVMPWLKQHLYKELEFRP